MTILVLIVKIVLGLFLLLLAAGFVTAIIDRRGKIECFSRLEDYIVRCIRGGCHETRMEVIDPSTDRRIAFVKMVPPRPGRGITRFFLRIESNRCSPEEFQRAREALEKAGIDHYVTSRLDPAPAAVVVHCDLDVGKALQAARCVLLDAFGLDETALLRFSIVHGYVDPQPRKMIGWDDHPPHAREAVSRERDATPGASRNTDEDQE